MLEKIYIKILLILIYKKIKDIKDNIKAIHNFLRLKHYFKL